MAQSEIEHVLANWIEQALSPIGRLADGTAPSEWVAKHFIEWWRTQAEDSLGDAEGAARLLREEIERLGGWNGFGQLMEEATHLQEALDHLRGDLGLSTPSTSVPPNPS